jgi:hypothetical protein
LADYLGIPEHDAVSLLPERKEEWKYTRGSSPEWSGYAGFIEDSDAAQRLLASLAKAK